MGAKWTSGDVKRFVAAARDGDLTLLNSFIERGLDSTVVTYEDDLGQTGLVAAAGAGRSDVVDLLLEAYGASVDLEPEVEIQAAFEAAADGGHSGLAGFLVSRWEAKPNRYCSTDEGIACPICYRFFHPGTCVTCEHYVCTESEGSYDNFRDVGGLSGQVEADLAELLGQVDKVRFEQMITLASPRQKKLLRVARKGGADFVSTGDESIGVEVDGFLIGWSMRYHFTHSPELLRERYVEVSSVLEWARANTPEDPEPPDESEVLETCDFCGEPITADRAYCSHFIVGWELDRGYSSRTGVGFHPSSSTRIVRATTAYCRALGQFHKAVRGAIGPRTRTEGFPTGKQLVSLLKPVLGKDWPGVSALAATIAHEYSESARLPKASLGPHVDDLLQESSRDVSIVEGDAVETDGERDSDTVRRFAIVMADVTPAEIGPQDSDYDDRVRSTFKRIGERTEALKRCTNALEAGNGR